MDFDVFKGIHVEGESFARVKMSPSVHPRSPIRRSSSNLSDSPRRGRSSMYSGSPRRRSSPRKERSPARRRSSPRTRSPTKTGSSHRTRSPIKEKLHSRTKPPENVKSPIRLRSSVSPSPSPRTKRLRRAQADHEADKLVERERDRHDDRGGDRGRNRERGPDRDGLNERRIRERYDGNSSRSKHGHSESLEDRGQRNRYNSSSPNRKAEGPRHDRQYDAKAGARDEGTDSRGEEPHRDGDDDSLAKMKAAEDSLDAKQKEKPSFELSGKLAAETNRVKGVTLLFTEPPDARKPNVRWRLYVFKAGEVLNEPLYVHRQSCYLFGRERRVADIPTDHPSCSKQHAVIQFRLVEKEQSDGLVSKKVRPYLMDLGSTNGTFINDNRIEPQRYYELVEKDTIKFGNSSREYVILHENSAE